MALQLLTALTSHAQVCADALAHGASVSSSTASIVSDPILRETPDFENLPIVSAASNRVESIWISGKSSNRLDIVFLGDGYTESEQDVFRSHVDLALEAFFNEEPFKSYKNLINVHIVYTSSEDSGVDNDPTNGVQRDTALDMRFWCFGSQRGLCVDLEKAEGLASLAPEADQIIVSANSTAYGGIGYSSNNIATFSGGNILSRELLLHEFGHSFGNLADEYDGADTIYQGSERSKANVSIFSEKDMLTYETKWSDWLQADLGEAYGGLVSTFEGGDLFSRGVFRPTLNSKMRSLGQPFNLPSIEAFVVELYKYVSPIDGVSHPEGEAEFFETLFVDPVDPLDLSIEIEWLLDGNKIEGQDDWFLSLSDLGLSSGEHTVTARVVDQTDFVRNQASREGLLTETFSWEVVVPESMLGTDVDNDGFTASEEESAGTDPYSSDSFPLSSADSLCSFPNGFLNQVNILNLLNSGTDSGLANVTYFSDDGAIAGTNSYFLEAGQKLDISLFDLGLTPNTIGTVCASSELQSLEGGLSLYSPDGNGAYEFALYYPLEMYKKGRSSALSLNTFNLVPSEPGAFNWLRLIDGVLGDGLETSGTLRFFDAEGQELREVYVELGDGKRIDFPAHEVLGSNAYGMATFTPDSDSMSYFFEVTRYFPKSQGGYYSAVPLGREVESTKPLAAITSVQPQLQDIVELSNTSNEAEEAFLVIRNSAGQAVKTEMITVSAYGSFHRIISDEDLTLHKYTT